MKQLSKIVWHEGMHLGPHHFQAQASFFEHALQFTTSTLCSNPYGFAAAEMNPEALRNGTVALAQARGVMPDGLVFHVPESDTEPAPRRAAEIFPATSHRLTLKLAVPAFRTGAANCAVDARPNDGSRFMIEERRLLDENTGADEKLVRVGRKNFQLLFENEPALDARAPDGSPQMVSLPIARVMRDGAGGFRYDETFIPPLLKITGSPRLMQLLGRLVQLLGDKSAWVSATARGRMRLPAGMSPQQVATFWFLHAINGSLAPLTHIYRSQQGHPEELYMELLKLGGALCTFALDAHPRMLPSYDHLNLSDCFEALDKQIRTLLEFMIPTNCVAVPLSPAAAWFYEADLADPRLTGSSKWILSVKAHLGEGDLIRAVPRLVKFCSAQFTPELVKRALPGMTLSHISQPPSAISPRLDRQYFSIDRGGPCWEHILQTKRVSAYIPDEIPAPEAELLVVLES